jgi:shikimate kinase
VIRVVRLVGPGGAGKTTVGAVLATSLGCAFLDFDREFALRHGDIGEFIASRGYIAYARANVETYLEIDGPAVANVMALSSGFMTYPSDVHGRYVEVREGIARSSSTFVLLPSVEIEECVAEIVRRQLTRPFGSRGTAREEAVIRERHGAYLALSATKIETMRPPSAVAAEIRAKLSPIRRMPARSES